MRTQAPVKRVLAFSCYVFSLTDNFINIEVTQNGSRKAKFYKANLRQQVISKLTSKLAVGESKHQDKINKIDKTKKIYSWSSFRTYQKQCLVFVRWLEQSHPEVKSINRAKPYIAEYLNHQLDKGCSAWTINTQAQSINKLYGIKKVINTSFNVQNAVGVI